MQREAMEYDVVIVGGGPSGLSAAIRLKQLAGEHGHDVSVCVVEKGSEVGAHILSGAVLEPRALNELIPDWQAKGAPLNTPATDDRFLFLTKTGACRLPTPPQMHNHGNYIVSLGNVCRWLATQAEALGVEIYPGFAAAEVLYGEDGRVVGVATGDMGIGKDGQPTENFQPGVELRGAYTLFAEGCRGSLTKTLFERFHLRDGVDPQTFGIGIKELWEVAPAKHKQGTIVHTIGWPLDRRTYGGSFLYHLENNQVAVGFVIGLDYENPYLEPVRGVPALQDPPGDPSHLRGRPAHRLRRPRAQRGRLPVDPEADLPGRRPDRLHRRLPQRAEDQGHAHRDEVRHDRRRGGVRRPPPGRGGRGHVLSRASAADLGVGRAAQGAQHPAGLPLGPVGRPRLFRNRHLSAARPGALDVPPPRRSAQVLRKRAPAKPIDYPKPDGKVSFDRLSSVFSPTPITRKTSPAI